MMLLRKPSGRTPTVAVLHRYVTLEIFRVMGLVLVAVTGIYLAVDFFEKIDDFMEASLSFGTAAAYFLLKIPFVAAQMFPVGLLLSVIVVFGLMNRNNETLALKSAGVGPFFLIKPVAAISLAGAVFLFILSEGIVPPSIQKANRIWRQDVRGEKAFLSERKNIWVRTRDGICNVRYFNTAKNAIHGVALTALDSRFRVTRRLDAEWGRYTDRSWTLFNVMEQRFDPDTGESSVRLLEEEQAELPFTPADLARVVKTPEEMSFTELSRYIDSLEAEGYSARRYRADLWAKASLPMACLILCTAGAGMVLRSRMREGLPAAIVIGIGTAFLFWVVHSFCMSLGYGGMLPPFIAAWSADAVFGALTVLLLLNVRKGAF